jgi:hypothetical protein
MLAVLIFRPNGGKKREWRRLSEESSGQESLRERERERGGKSSQVVFKSECM